MIKYLNKVNAVENALISIKFFLFERIRRDE